MDRPSVSVIIPTRGRRQLLQRAVASVVEQDLDGSIECVVVFDGQQPTEIDEPSRPDRVVRRLANGHEPGPAGARNSGLEIAAGDLIAFLDDDDEWSSDKLRRQLGLLRRRPDAVAATCGVRVLSGDRSFYRVPGASTISYQDLISSRRAEVHTSTLLLPRAEMERAGPFDETLPLGYGEDYDWLLRVARSGPLAVERAPLATLRLGNSWFSERWDTISLGVQEQLRRHPELATHRRNLGRMYGRIAFAEAASGGGMTALRWAGRSMLRDPLQWRAFAAVAVALHLIAPERVVRTVRARGRGV